MKTEEHLLTKLIEECGEVAKECCKALTFGLDDKVTIDPNGPRGTTGPTNREKIVHELNDLIGVVNMLSRIGILPHNWQDAEKQAKKDHKVSLFMGYARRVGALE